MLENSKKTLELELVNKEKQCVEQGETIADMKANVKSFLEYHLSRGDTLKSTIYYWDQNGSPYKQFSPKNNERSILPSIMEPPGRRS